MDRRGDVERSAKEERSGQERMRDGEGKGEVMRKGEKRTGLGRGVKKRETEERKGEAIEKS